MKKIPFLMAILTLLMMSCTKDDLSVPNNSSVQTRESNSQRVQITSDAPIINNTIIALVGTPVELYAVPYMNSNSCKWTVNGKLATEVHGPSITLSSNRPGSSRIVQVTVFDSADKGSTSPRVEVKWVSQ